MTAAKRIWALRPSLRGLISRMSGSRFASTNSPNSGPACARNVALRLTTGPLIAFLDSDDLWQPAFVSTLVDLLRRNPSCAVGISGNVCIDVEDQVTGVNRLEWAEASEGVLRMPFETFVKGFSFCTSATLIKRSALDAVGPLDETLKQWEDADLWLRLSKRFDFAYSEALLLCKRGHDANISNTKVDWYESQVRVLLRHRGTCETVRHVSSRSGSSSWHRDFFRRSCCGREDTPTIMEPCFTTNAHRVRCASASVIWQFAGRRCSGIRT